MKCPHCDKVLTRVTLKPLDGQIPLDQSKWKCVAYGCPVCQKAISIQMDPIALKADTIAEVKRLLGR